MKAVDKADMVLAIGYDIAEYAPRPGTPRKTRRSSI